MIHRLDQFRHFLSYAWAINTWVGNITAGVVVALCASLLWPRIRRRIHAFVDTKLAAHHAAIKEHIAQEIAKLK